MKGRRTLCGGPLLSGERLSGQWPRFNPAHQPKLETDNLLAEKQHRPRPAATVQPRPPSKAGNRQLTRRKTTPAPASGHGPTPPPKQSWKPTTHSPKNNTGPGQWPRSNPAPQPKLETDNSLAEKQHRPRPAATVQPRPPRQSWKPTTHSPKNNTGPDQPPRSNPAPKAKLETDNSLAEKQHRPRPAATVQPRPPTKAGNRQLTRRKTTPAR